MNKEELIQMLKEELNEYHPEFEYEERFGFESAIALIEEFLYDAETQDTKEFLFKDDN